MEQRKWRFNFGDDDHAGDSPLRAIKAALLGERKPAPWVTVDGLDWSGDGPHEWLTIPTPSRPPLMRWAAIEPGKPWRLKPRRLDVVFCMDVEPGADLDVAARSGGWRWS